MRAAVRVVAVCIALFALAACAPQARPPVSSRFRVLFVGNSYTLRNGGLDAQLMRLDPSLEASSVASPGFTLRDHWNDGSALRAIREGAWTCVVLQEHSVSPVLSAPEFSRYGRFFDAAIRGTGARTALLMTWERPDAVASGVTSQALAAAYVELGDSMGASVAPVGTAFADSIAQRPDLALNLDDGHPTANGTYLAACVVYGTLRGRSPLGNVSPDPLIAAESQAFFQQVAARALGY